MSHCHVDWRSAYHLLLAGMSLVASGCGSSLSSEAHNVEGILLVDGSPAANASVAFHPIHPGPDPRYPVARTDGEGRFRLITSSDSTAVPLGEYLVTVVWIDQTIPFDECECDDPLIHDRLKGYYADPELTELRATVRASGNSFRLYTRRPAFDDPALCTTAINHRSRP